MLIPRLQFNYLRQDISAGFVVFLVALPLCIGIAVASETPPLAGIITGIVAGILVSLLSGSELSVSGPAAGLVITVIAAQKTIGDFNGFLVAVILSGLLQIGLGAIRAGLLATFFPSSVIKGMLAGIGIIIAAKQLPYAIGWRGAFNPEEGIFCFLSPFCLHSLFSSMEQNTGGISIMALLVSGVSIFILAKWDRLGTAKGGFFRTMPGPLVAVIFGIGFNAIIGAIAPSLALSGSQGQLVSIPPLTGLGELFSHGPSSLTPWLWNKSVWLSAVAITLIGSVETLLCIEATDKLDPLRRVSRPNRELVAQGVGNMVTGALGGIPMTSVIVRSSANVYAGGRTRVASIVHGALLLLSVLLLAPVLNRIPLAALAAVLIIVGYKLASPKLIKQVWASGYDQFLPFAVTAIGVVVLDLLTGVMIGTVFGLGVVLIMNHHAAFTVIKEDTLYYFRFAKDVTFLQKIALKKALARIPDNSIIVIDGGTAMFIDHDILELIQNFSDSATNRHIQVELRNFPSTKFNLFSAISAKGA